MDDCFLVVILPPAGDKTERTEELGRAKRALAAIGPTCSIVVNEFIVCLLVQGRFDAITAALDEALSSYTRSFVARAARPTEAAGLSAIESWLAARLPR